MPNRRRGSLVSAHGVANVLLHGSESLVHLATNLSQHTPSYCHDQQPVLERAPAQIDWGLTHTLPQQQSALTLRADCDEGHPAGTPPHLGGLAGAGHLCKCLTVSAWVAECVCVNG